MRWEDAREPGAAAQALARAWPGTLAVPVRTPVHQSLLDGARWWTARAEDGESLCLRVADGLLLELLAAPETDSRLLAAACREAGPAAGVRRVRFRTDDPLLLPLTMTGRPPSHFRIGHRLWVRGPRPWHEVRRWEVLSAEEWHAGLRPRREVAGEAVAVVVECAEGDGAAADLRRAGYRDAVQVLEAAWTPGTGAHPSGP